MHKVKKGNLYTWHGLAIIVTRVAGDRTWADIRVFDGRRHWGKRQPLPFPDSFIYAPDTAGE